MNVNQVELTLPADNGSSSQSVTMGKLPAHLCAVKCVGDETPSKVADVPTLRILTFTWNVGSTAPTRDALAELAKLAERKHIVVVGLQKVPQTILNYLVEKFGCCGKHEEHPEVIHKEMSERSMFSEKTDMSTRTFPAKAPATEWGRALVDCFAGLGLEPLQPVTTFGKRLAVFIKTELVEEVESFAVGHIHGTAKGFHSKGAVALRFELFRFTFCFVNVWLAAGRHNKRQRNKDFHHISDNMGMRGTKPDGKMQTWSLPGHDVLLWIGCQNTCFNIHEGKRIKDIVAAIHKNNMELLHNLDSLMEASHVDESGEKSEKRKVQKAFDSVGADTLQEGPLNFPPTATYVKNKEDIDEGDIYKQHIPGHWEVKLGWCDRVLFHSSKKAAELTLLQYNWLPSLNQAKHRPVFADFALPVSPGNVSDDLRQCVFKMPSVPEGR